VLRWSARRGHAEVVRLLLGWPRHPARADAVNSDALHQAAHYGRAEVVRLLLGWPEHPALADSRDSFALRQAAENGHAEVVRLLLGWPRHPARADSCNSDALHQAANGGHAQVVRLLLGWPEHPARADADACAAMVSAATHGHTEVVRELLGAEGAARADVGDSVVAPYAAAAAAAGVRAEVAGLLLGWPRHPVLANSSDDWALVAAAREGQWDFAELLLTLPTHLAARTDALENAALLEAARNGNDASVRALLQLQHGASPCGGHCMLVMAVRACSARAVPELLTLSATGATKHPQRECLLSDVKFAIEDVGGRQEAAEIIRLLPGFGMRWYDGV
jgi:cytohesin